MAIGQSKNELDLVVELTEDGQKRQIRQRVTPAAYSIGSDPRSAICIDHSGVSRQHARLYFDPSSIEIEDLGSTNGTYVDGVRIKRRVRIHVGQRIAIGPCAVWLDYPKRGKTDAGPARRAETLVPTTEVASDESGEAMRATIRKIKTQIHAEMLKRLDLKRLISNPAAQKSLQDKVRVTAADIVQEVRDQLPPHLPPAQLTREIIQEAIGLGPLDDL
ncbi:MAG: FHA domain-containing protein, partial [Verrucomicrobia bacterium]|nr:FHA domain-containing protein [Verrucomicrobiota bacterium]